MADLISIDGGKSKGGDKEDLRQVKGMSFSYGGVKVYHSCTSYGISLLTPGYLWLEDGSDQDTFVNLMHKELQFFKVLYEDKK